MFRSKILTQKIRRVIIREEIFVNSANIEDYVGQDIIARGEYNIDFEGELNTKCYMYPLYILSKESGNWETIENRAEAFPERGAIEVDIKDGQTAQDVVKRNRQLFKIKLTVSPQMSNGIISRNNQVDFSGRESVMCHG